MERDLRFGSEQEELILPILSQYFGEDISKADKYSKYDFYSPTSYYELKSRNVSLGKYPTTLLPADKIQDCDKSQRFVFNFTDCIGYIEYDKELFDSFDTNDFRRHRVGVYDKKKPYVYIPTDKLIQIPRNNPVITTLV